MKKIITVLGILSVAFMSAAPAVQAQTGTNSSASVEIEGLLDREGSDDSKSVDSSLEIEVDVFTDITTIKVEQSDRKSFYETDLKDRGAIVAEIAARLGISEERVESVISFENETRASRDQDREKSAMKLEGEVMTSHSSSGSSDALDDDSDDDSIDDSMDDDSDDDSFNENRGEDSMKVRTTLSTGLNFEATRRERSDDGEVMVKTRSEVRNADDLKVYAETIVQEDNNVEEVEADDEEVVVTTNHKARLFGFIPVNARAETHVSFVENDESKIEGRVKVKFPWWRFLAKVENHPEASTEEITTRVENTLNTKTELSAEAVAEIIEHITVVLEAKAAAEAETTTE